MVWEVSKNNIQNRDNQLNQWVQQNWTKIASADKENIPRVTSNILGFTQNYVKYIKMVSDEIIKNADTEYDMSRRDSPLGMNKQVATQIARFDGMIKNQAKSIMNDYYNPSHAILLQALNEVNANGQKLQEIKDRADNIRIQQRQRDVITLMKGKGYDDDEIQSFMTSPQGSKLINNKTAHLEYLNQTIDQYNQWKVQQVKNEQMAAKQAAERAAQLQNQGTIKRTSGKKLTRLLVIDEAYLNQVKTYVESLGGEVK